ncbi:WD40 repeat domain-containing protein [Sporobolomyces koalae]|uniref:WD40 repeat domain-containing protein n=1 Tax=Sporobolomyces koalae TaxID=500713 RepID=UPI00316E5CA1
MSLSRSVDYSQPPAPCYILRGHTAPITQLLCSPTRSYWLFSGDSQGVVALWDLRSFRPVLVWKPHDDGILSLEQVGSDTLLTHARDNKVHVHSIDHLLKRTARTSPASFLNLGTSPPPAPLSSLDVNALNFCRLSLLDLSPTRRLDRKGKAKQSDYEGLIAMPSLTKDDHVDIFHIPSGKRLHRSVGIQSLSISNPEQKTGSVMAVHLLWLPSSASTSSDTAAFSTTVEESPDVVTHYSLHLLIGYESGQLVLLEFTPTSSFASSASLTHDIFTPLEGRMVEENEGWNLVWVEKCHRDAVMSVEVTENQRFAYTVGADHLITKYRLYDLNEEESRLPRTIVEATDSPGKSIVKLRKGSNDPRTKQILAVAGWNGEVRVYSNKTLTLLASLNHHRNSVQALDFVQGDARTKATNEPLIDGESEDRGQLGEESEDSSEESDDEDAEDLAGILVTGGMDAKICLWKIYPP